MILLVGGEEEERTSVSRSTGRPSIIQPPPITLTVCLVIGWTINDDLKRRRTTILSSREEERTKQRRPRGLTRGMETHLITRPTSAKDNTVERRGGVVWEDEKRTVGGLHWRRQWAKEMTEKGV